MANARSARRETPASFGTPSRQGDQPFLVTTIALQESMRPLQGAWTICSKRCLPVKGHACRGN